MIKSFTIDHTRLKPGIYVSREDSIGKERATTYDLRVCLPNKEQLTPEIAHTIEHLMADYYATNGSTNKKLFILGLWDV